HEKIQRAKGRRQKDVSARHSSFRFHPVALPSPEPHPMNRSEYLFPNRLNRRQLLALGAAAAAAGISTTGRADDAKPPVRIGSGKWTYTLDESWGQLPQGMSFGFGCGIVVDGKDRIIVTSRSANPCVAIFAPDGKLLETWSKDFGDHVGYTTDQVAATAHGIY